MAIQRHANGLIAVDQCMVNGFRLTYNPDDERFWVDAPDGEDWINRATFAGNAKGLENAKYWARTHTVK